jgi:hypothetical protein
MNHQFRFVVSRAALRRLPASSLHTETLLYKCNKRVNLAQYCDAAPLDRACNRRFQGIHGNSKRYVTAKFELPLSVAFMIRPVSTKRLAIRLERSVSGVSIANRRRGHRFQN